MVFLWHQLPNLFLKMTFEHACFLVIVHKLKLCKFATGCKSHATQKQCCSKVLAEDSVDHRHLPSYLNYDGNEKCDEINLDLLDSVSTVGTHFV